MTHQILTGYPIDLKLVAKRPGWILMNLQIPQARRLSALICSITILMVGGAETAPPNLSRVKIPTIYIVITFPPALLQNLIYRLRAKIYKKKSVWIFVPF